MLIRRAAFIAAIILLWGNLILAQELIVDVDAIKTLVQKWNDAHNESSVNDFPPLYSNMVNFYGSSLQRDRCISIKRDLLKEHPDYKQVVNGDLLLSGYSTGVIRADFVKTVTHDGKTTDYEAYLIIERISGKYVIIGESDLVTDINADHVPDLGKKVTIKRKVDAVKPTDPIRRDFDISSRTFTGIFQLIIALMVGTIGLIFAFRHYGKPAFILRIENFIKSLREKKKSEPVKERRTKEETEKGLAFEKYIVEMFAINKSFFTLQEWRSDKFHEGVYPASNRNPDLEYTYQAGNFIRRFSVECKYRTKAQNGNVHLMDDTKYKIYEAFHRTKMPVYIVLGFRGEPGNPAELFLIPFQFVKPEMSHNELTKFRKTGKFFYDMHTDQLT